MIPHPLAYREDADLLGPEPWRPEKCCGSCPMGANDPGCDCPHSDACCAYEAWSHARFMADDNRLSVAYRLPDGRLALAQLGLDAAVCFVGGPRGHDAARHKRNLARFGGVKP